MDEETGGIQTPRIGALSVYWSGHAPDAAPIAALPADDSARAQALMRIFAETVRAEGLRVGGLTQTRREDARGRSRLALACAAVEEAARAGVDVIFISKFAKQEAARAGLCDAFRAAISTRVPVVTAVSPYFRDEWREFAGDLSVDVAPDAQSLGEWWSRIRAAAARVVADPRSAHGRRI